MANTHQRDNKIETESLPKICHLLLEKTEISQVLNLCSSIVSGPGNL